jgi:protocatechuate 3,4-dioxygenase alpha subunit
LSPAVTPSQTVGPFFGVGLPYKGSEQPVKPGTPGLIRLEGQVVDGKGDPVPDALIEIWEPSIGFGRCRTDPEGAFHFLTAKPASAQTAEGRSEAPHLNLTVFARGLLRHLLTRVYFPDESAANENDPVLSLIDPARRPTLVARQDGQVLRFDIRLQGENETVFFAI